MNETIRFVQSAAAGIFPLDKQWGLSKSVYSIEFSKRMVWLSGLLPYEQCQQVFGFIGECSIPSSSIWRQTQYYGEQLQEFVECQREQVSVERIVIPDAIHDHGERKAVSIDGGMVNIRGQGWRELKVGAVFELETRQERNPQTKQMDEMIHGVDVHYTAVLGNREQFTPALWALAVKHDVPTAKQRAVVGDGAIWIWNVAEDVCPDGRQIVDWYHATQKLSSVSHAIYPNEGDDKNRLRWVKTMKDHLYHGRIHKIINALGLRQRDDLALYFVRHQRRMQYLEFREERWPIGSGTVESGVKQFKHRLTGAGMRWNEDNANRMLVIRAAVLGHDFHELWDLAA